MEKPETVSFCRRRLQNGAFQVVTSSLFSELPSSFFYMGETVREVLYETRNHASRPYCSNYPPQQLNEGAKGSFLSLPRGLSQIKEKWSDYRRPKKLKRWVSLFVSLRGERVAVAAGNQITILQKDDNYQEPCGIFTSNSLGTFIYGAWSESHDVLGVCDDSETLYFIKGNGEEMARKVIVTLIPAEVNGNVYRCSFNLLTSDGFLHNIEISQDPAVSISSFRTSSNGLTLKKQFPQHVFCLDYHVKLSLLIVVGSASSISITSSGTTGSHHLSLWRRSSSLDLEPVCSTQVEGLYSKPKGYIGQITSSKVLISPHGKFVATLDLTGCLDIFKLDGECCSLSSFAYGMRNDAQETDNLSNEVGKFLNGIVDFTWWSDHTLVLAKRSGTVIMLDILSGIKLLGNDPIYSMPVLERVQQFQGQFFLLESTSSEEKHNISTHGETGDLHHIELVTEDRLNQADIARLQWSLISFSERSVPEMYNILISNTKYQAALEFAVRHGLDTDEVLKSQWLHSGQGINEINTLLSNIKDQDFVLSECVNKVGPTEDAVKALLAYGLHLTSRYRFSESDDHGNGQIWDFRKVRLQLLQFRDRLETFLGINMGSLGSILQMVSTDLQLNNLVLYRFSVQEYNKFRIMPINEAAVALAESGKIGALNLLFKRHPYTLTPSMLEILAAVPETIPVQTYGQLLPGRSPPTSFALREEDWVECEKMVSFINRLPEDKDSSIRIRTEPIVRQILGFSGHQLMNFLVDYKKAESFLVRWLKEVALENKLDICLMVIEEGCKDYENRWSTMTAILSKLPHVQVRDYDGMVSLHILDEGLEQRLKLAEGHIEAGRLLHITRELWENTIRYSFCNYLGAVWCIYCNISNDQLSSIMFLEKVDLVFNRTYLYSGSKAIKFLCRGTSDEKGVKQILRLILSKFVRRQPSRGLLKAGKFSLARNYLKGTGPVSLASEKAENLVIQAAREYFFSASSLACSEIWKAKECLKLFPGSRNVKAEADVIDALTVKLPELGVTLLPMQFRQIKDPMEIIKMAITSQAGAYLQVDELIEIAKLLGLNSQDDVSAVEEAIAREAAVAGDLQLAFDLCLSLAKKGHGPIWDLCAAIARGPALENMDINSRKQLLGFALSHCDEESIGELLHAWKDLDTQGQCETLMMSTGTNPPNFSIQGSSVISLPVHSIQDIVNLRDCSKLVEGADNVDQEDHFNDIKNMLSLPWLLELSRKTEHGKKYIPGSIPGQQYISVRTEAILSILSWLARNGFAPRDDLIASLAKSIIEPPVTGMRISWVGMTYSLVHSSGVECEGPAQRRELLLRKFQEKHMSHSLDEIDKLDKVQSTFWREWKLKLEEQKRLADHSRVLEKIIPGVETTRFLSGDFAYIKSVVLSLIESVKLEKKHILKDVLKLADTYGLNHTEMLLRFLNSVLISEVWSEDDIIAEFSEVKGEMLACAVEAIKIISLIIYPAIDGSNKPRLAYIYSLLSDCYLKLEEIKQPLPVIHSEPVQASTIGLAHFYKVVEQECRRVSFIKNLNFKNIAVLGGLNIKCFKSEVLNHIDEHSLEALAKMVQNLVNMYTNPLPEGLISWQDTVYQSLGHSDSLDIMKRYFTVIIPLKGYSEGLPDNSTWQDCLIVLLNFWIKLTDDMMETVSHETSREKLESDPESLTKCLKVFIRLVMEESVSPSQGWNTVLGYVNYGLVGGSAVEVFFFCRAMVFSGCGFGAIAEVFSEAALKCPSSSTLLIDTEGNFDGVQDLPHLYLNILDPILQNLVAESHEHQNLHRLLSSLSKLEGNLEDLTRVRHAVWERIVMFSDNLELPSHVRVYALELMQFISGGNIKGFSAELQSNILPWEDWHELHFTSKSSETTTNQGLPDHADTSSRFTSTLVALKSSQLVAAISSSIEITPDDLLTVDAAVSCFSRFCGAATTDPHIDALLAVLGEWEGLFVIQRDFEASPEAHDTGNNWSSEDWDEGWESFQEEEPAEKEKNKESSFSVHPLHACWMEIFKKLIMQSRFSDLLKLIDRSLTKSNGMLLDEDDAQSLTQTVLGVDCFVALKMVLLLPYEAMQLQCVNSVEEKLKQGGISDTIGRDHELLLLVLSSGIISNIITQSSYGATFSYLCYLVGNFSRQYQEAQLSKHKHQESNNPILLLFRRTLFPCFISELVKADQSILAGLFLTKFMHTNAALSLINIADSSLSRYLERELQALQGKEFDPQETGSCDTLGNTVSSLRGKLRNSIESALASLSSNVR
ncbi:MAG2-interacting protein 2 [Vitis vinifera]|uniref:MAG2-interacting protein 2 n=1 Tax=Vitis vinifera TaxID=29760 RepID=A0A438HWX3_VITVI|nr:MAG2-interacting protein 2 [Vitis vinifera]